MPVAADVWRPDYARTTLAVEGSEGVARAEEVLATVSRRLPADEICDCILPDGTLTHSLITRDDAAIRAQNISSDVTIRGSLIDGAPGSAKTFEGKVTLGATVLTGVWNIAGGLETGVPLSSGFHWYDFEMLAFSLMQGEYEGNFRVIVRDTGGTFTQTDFGFGDAQVENGAHTLVVFKTGEEIVLDRSPDGREFGPSVLAPFSKDSSMVSWSRGSLLARMREETLNCRCVAEATRAHSSALALSLHRDDDGRANFVSELVGLALPPNAGNSPPHEKGEAL